MVTKLRTFKRTGVFEFFVIRLTAVFQALYFLVISFYWFQVEPVNFSDLTALFDNILFKIWTFLILVSISYHAMSGMLNIAHDYLTSRLLGNVSGFVKKLFSSFMLGTSFRFNYGRNFINSELTLWQ